MPLQTKLKTNGNQKKGHDLIKFSCFWPIYMPLSSPRCAGQVHCRDSMYPILQKGTGMTDLPILRASRFHWLCCYHQVPVPLSLCIICSLSLLIVRFQDCGSTFHQHVNAQVSKIMVSHPKTRYSPSIYLLQLVTTRLSVLCHTHYSCPVSKKVVKDKGSSLGWETC